MGDHPNALTARPGPSARTPTSSPDRGSSTSSRRWMLSPSCAVSTHTRVSSADSPTWSNPSRWRSESEKPITSGWRRISVAGPPRSETCTANPFRSAITPTASSAPSASPSGQPFGAPGNTSRGSPPSKGTASHRPDSSPVGSENQTTLEPSAEIVAAVTPTGSSVRRLGRSAPSSHAYAWNDPSSSERTTERSGAAGPQTGSVRVGARNRRSQSGGSGIGRTLAGVPRRERSGAHGGNSSTGTLESAGSPSAPTPVTSIVPG